MVLVHGNYLSKPMVNLMAIISISLTYRLSFEAYIQEMENFPNSSWIMPTFCYTTIQPTSITTWAIFAEKCSHEALRITLAALHKQKSDPSLTWIHPTIPWHYSKLPTAVSSHHAIYPATAKVWKVTVSVKASHHWEARWVLHSPCYFWS